MVFKMTPEIAARMAGLELNAFAAAGAFPGVDLEGTKVASSGTPIYDINGEILFYRVPVQGAIDGFADVAAYPGFGDLVLRFSTGFAWDEKTLIAPAEEAAKKNERSLQYDEVRFVAYSYPYVAVQFLAADKEVAMIELGSRLPVPPATRKNLETPLGPFERWSLIVEQKAADLAEHEKQIVERFHQWQKLDEVVKAQRLDPLVIAPQKFLKATQAVLLPHVELHRAGLKMLPQKTPFWGVPASLQMMLDFYRYPYSQEQIAALLGQGTLQKPTGLPLTQVRKVAQTLEVLNGQALVTATDMTPTVAEMYNELRNNRPLLSFAGTHARAVDGYLQVQLFKPPYLKRVFIVYDPVPIPHDHVEHEIGQIVYENANAMQAIHAYSRTVTAQVKLVRQTSVPAAEVEALAEV